MRRTRAERVAKHYGCKLVKLCGLIGSGRRQAYRDFALRSNQPEGGITTMQLVIVVMVIIMVMMVGVTVLVEMRMMLTVLVIVFVVTMAATSIVHVGGGGRWR